MRFRHDIHRAAPFAALFLFMAALPSAAPSVARADVETERLTLITSTNRHNLTIEVARTPEEKALGLMFRTELAQGRGMLFPYEKEQELTMWMRNTYIPLDMVFIRSNGTIHRIEERTEPFSERIIASHGPVSAVLELAAGEAQRLGLKPGDTVLGSHFTK